MRRVRLEPAYVLSARPYRESSALLEVFTAGHGRAGLVARGARGTRSRLRGLLQPFQRLLLSWTDAGELGTLSAAEADGPPAMLEGEAVFSGWYLNELLLRMTARRDPHPALFDDYAQALEALCGASPVAAAGVIERNRMSPALVLGASLRCFEKRLLAELGYGLHLPEDLAPDRWYRYEGDGSLRLAEPGPASYRGACLHALAREQFDSEEQLHDAQRLLRDALAPHLGG